MSFFIHNCDTVLDRFHSSVRIEPTYRDKLIESENEPHVLADVESLHQLEKSGWEIDRHPKLDQTDPHTHDNKPVDYQQGYVNYMTSAHEAICRSGKPNFRGCKIPVRSNLNISFLENELVDYHDKEILNFVRYGWPIGLTEEVTQSKRFSNHSSTNSYPVEMETYFRQEILEGNMLGPFKTNPFSSPIFISPLCTVDKKDSIERRVITDLRKFKKIPIHFSVYEL